MKIALFSAIMSLFTVTAHAQSPGWIPSMGDGVVAYLHGANMNITTDQALIQAAPGTNWQLVAIEVTNCSASPSGAVGGFYPSASKGGTAYVAASQTYTALATVPAIQVMTLAAGIATTRFTNGATIKFSLTTALGSAATCDVYAIGRGLP